MKAANRSPASRRPMAAPAVRATPVNPPAADRSSTGTTAIVQECLLHCYPGLTQKRGREAQRAGLVPSGLALSSGTFARRSSDVRRNCVSTALTFIKLHIPDPIVTFEASVNTLAKLRSEGKIRLAALSKGHAGTHRANAENYPHRFCLEPL